MISLEDLQSGLLGLIKSRGVDPTHSYSRHAAASRGLGVVRETALFWRAFQLQNQCPLTCRLLARLGRFEPVLADYFSCNATSPFVEQLTADFLRWLRHQDDELIRAVSQFELAALQDSEAGEVYEIFWDRDPDRVLLALQNGSELPAAEKNARYRVRVDRTLSDGVACIRERAGPHTAEAP